ncbi:beta-lactamase domain-containing protein 2-like [Saccoglossus kowalevskii]|uniref:Beta-lactamase domain-containing protein 2-like n=1 Tax=Saccoglossus kowalevskii TaxID=10224 RepID=A0ABM0MIS9_SACKO|nr:PREDICTED: beta-lactamase domain-containing protein 2-like [Saccoglossus kowalevskii]
MIVACLISALVTTVVIILLSNIVTKKKPPRVDGHVDSGFEEVFREFRRCHEQNLDVGSAVAVYYKGKKVVDLWGGYADYEAEEPWQQNTMTMVFSATKGVAALCVAVAVDRGYLDYDQKVSHYWPDFAQNGKENITVRQVVCHEAGIPMTAEPLTFSMLEDQHALGETLASSKLLWEPGTKHGYHSVAYGLLLSQLIQRSDPKHRTIGEFFREEISKPYGIDFHIGLPKKEHYRVARILVPSPFTLTLHLLQMLTSSRSYKFAMAMFNPRTLTSKVLRSTNHIVSLPKMNSLKFRSLEIPSLNGIGTASGLAKLYGIVANSGTLGKTLLSEDTIELFTSKCTPVRMDQIIMLQTQWCLGLHPHFDTIPQLNLKGVYGHNGYGGQGTFFDKANNLSFAYVTTKLSAYGMGEDPRYVAMVTAIYSSIEKLKMND